MNIEIHNDEKLVFKLATPSPRNRDSGFQGSNDRRNSVYRRDSGMIRVHSRENNYMLVFLFE